MTATAWAEFLQGTAPSEHGVLVYRDPGELAASVAAFAGAGLDAGEPALVVATSEHRIRIEEALAVVGWDQDRIERSGLLFHAEAEATLAEILDDAGSLSADRLERALTSRLDRIGKRFPGRRVRVFGEMVDLLCRRGDQEAAAALEALWERRIARGGMALMCSYRLDVFDRATQAGVLPGICRAHSHVRPAADPERLQRAVDAALDEALGDNAGQLYAMVGDQIRRRRVPAAQLALMWVSTNMPTIAERILASARTHYLRERYTA
jgi:KaiC/GvpD/RAD55 family RecA-like ATPase